MCSDVSNSATPWTVTHQTFLSMEFSRQKYCGVGCHFLLHWIFLTQVSNPCLLHLLYWQVGSLLLYQLGSPNKVKVRKLLSCVQLFATPYTIQPMQFSRSEYWSARVGCHALLQEIFPTQRLNPGLWYCRWILYQLSYQGSPRILERVAIPSPVDLPNPGIEPGSPALQADSLPAKEMFKKREKENRNNLITPSSH